MIPVESVIEKLVNEFEFVVIPGFGALLSRQVPAHYDSNSGKFAPPSKRLAFNEYVKLDDGLLANYISRHEKISHNDAIAYINSYTSSLREDLEKDGSAVITGIGSFSGNSEGKLVFEPGSQNYFKDDWYGFHQIAVKVAEPRALIKPALTTEETEVVYLDEEQEEVSGGRRWGLWAAAAAVSGLLVYFSFFLVSGNADLNKSNLNPFSYFFERKTSTEETPAVESIATEPVVEESAVVVDSVSVPADSVTPPVVEVTEVVKEEAPVATLTEQRYFLIAGAFKGARQAGVLLEEMKAKGYPDAILIPADERSKKVKVAVQGFASEADAYAASGKLKSVIGEAGWVYHKR